MTNLLLILSLSCGVWGIVSIFVIASYLSKHGVKVSILFLRVLALKYLSQYHDISKNKNGKTGFWFYSYIISMNLALVLALTGMILK